MVIAAQPDPVSYSDSHKVTGWVLYIPGQAATLALQAQNGRDGVGSRF
jgi:hypothetical protein